MSNLFKVTARGKYLATVKAVKPAGVIGSTFPNGEYLAPDREAIAAAIPHQWRKAFETAQLGQFSRQGGPFEDECHYWVYGSRHNLIVRINCEPYEYQSPSA